LLVALQDARPCGLRWRCIARAAEESANWRKQLLLFETNK
jgi:hypothetical protein